MGQTQTAGGQQLQPPKKDPLKNPFKAAFCRSQDRRTAAQEVTNLKTA